MSFSKWMRHIEKRPFLILTLIFLFSIISKVSAKLYFQLDKNANFVFLVFKQHFFIYCTTIITIQNYKESHNIKDGKFLLFCYKKVSHQSFNVGSYADIQEHQYSDFLFENNSANCNIYLLDKVLQPLNQKTDLTKKILFFKYEDKILSNPQEQPSSYTIKHTEALLNRLPHIKVMNSLDKDTLLEELKPISVCNKYNIISSIIAEVYPKSSSKLEFKLCFNEEFYSNSENMNSSSNSNIAVWLRDCGVYKNIKLTLLGRGGNLDSLRKHMEKLLNNSLNGKHKDVKLIGDLFRVDPFSENEIDIKVNNFKASYILIIFNLTIIGVFFLAILIRSRYKTNDVPKELDFNRQVLNNSIVEGEINLFSKYSKWKKRIEKEAELNKLQLKFMFDELEASKTQMSIIKNKINKLSGADN